MLGWQSHLPYVPKLAGAATDFRTGGWDLLRILKMAVQIKTLEDIEGMRVAGRLAAEVLDFIGPHMKSGVTTGEIDRLCHQYMVETQGTIPAPLNYAPPGYKPYPKSICTSVNHQVCHGVPGERILKNGDIVNIDITVI